MIVARLHAGEDILTTVQQVVRQYDVRSGVVSIIGAVSRATLGFFDREKREYRSNTFARDLEIVSCTGNIARLDDGTVVVHAHMVVADDEGHCYGGHVMNGCEVSATGEVTIIEGSVELHRAPDPTTGLALLALDDGP